MIEGGKERVRRRKGKRKRKGKETNIFVFRTELFFSLTWFTTFGKKVGYDGSWHQILLNKGEGEEVRKARRERKEKESQEEKGKTT